jgi:hypothetical protein
VKVFHPPNPLPGIPANANERLRASHANLNGCLYPSGLIVDFFV